MIIEFTGLVGSGKSTLAQASKQFLLSSGVKAFSPPEAVRSCFERSTLGRALTKWFPVTWQRKAAKFIPRLELRLVYPFFFTLAYPGLVLHVIRTAPALKVLPTWHRRIILRLFFEVAGQYYYLRRRLIPGEVVLFEEGLLHRAINLYAWEPGPINQQMVAKYLRLLPAPDLAVFIKAAPDLCLKRARERGLPSRLKDKNTQVVEQFMANTVNILALAEKNRGQSILEVDNSTDLDQALFALHQGLETILPGAGTKQAAPTLQNEDKSAARQVVYQRKPVFSIPRADQLYKQIHLQQRHLNGDGQSIQQVLKCFGLSFSGETGAPPGLGRSKNWILVTPDGKKFLKCYKESVDLEAIRHEHSILTYLAETGFPAPRLLSTTGGSTFVEQGGKFYALFDYLDGYFQFHHYIFSPHQTGEFVASCGQALAVLHDVLKEFEPAGCNPNGFQPRQGPRWRELPWYMDQLQQVRQAGNERKNLEEGSLIREISNQASWVEGRLQALDEILRTAALPRLIIHGDYGPYNVFFKPGNPVMILDFELSRLDWRLTDLANALYFFAIGRSGFRSHRMAQFLEGYFSADPAAREEIPCLPDVWQFLLLRRVIVCWHRFLETAAGQWQAEAQRKLDLAHWIEDHREILLDPSGSKRIQTRVGR